jgi:hypothetical protein
MFVGHLAAAFAAKKVEPGVPLGAAVAASFGIDLLWPVLLLFGLETVRVSPGDTAFTSLAFESYPWSHSLLAVVGWSVLAAGLGRVLLGSWRAGVVLGALVSSHWMLDLVTHRPDLPLWPDGPLVGLGLWNSVPGTMAVEGSALIVGLAVYLGVTSARDRTGVMALLGLVALTTLIWVSQPWAPPPPSAQAVAWGAFASFLLPPWAHWIERHRSVHDAASAPADPDPA